MDFKWIVVLALVAVSSSVSATGIPVYCFNCQEGSSNAAHSILDGIRSQTEALLNGADFVMRNNQTIDMIGLQTEQKIKNSVDLEPSMGAKPRPACGQAAGAAIRGATASAGKKTREILTKTASSYNKRTSGLSPTEPRRDYVVRQILSEMDKPEFDAAQLIMETNPIDPTDATAYRKKLDDTLLATNPFPVELPSEEQQERIKRSGAPGDKETLAQAVVLEKRQQVAQYSILKEFEANTQRIEPKGLKYMLDDITPYLSDEEQKKLDGKLSPNQLEELMATYRVRSEKWVKFVSASPSQSAVLKELALIGAEQLNQMFKLNTNIKELTRMQSIALLRETSQSGLTSK